MIPDLVDIGGPWKVLPPGVHDASLTEVRMRYATSDLRRALCDGLERGCAALQAAGCSAVYVDGSYVTSKEDPGDYDACWDRQGVDRALVDPVLFNFRDRRKAQKAKYGGEFFPSDWHAEGRYTFLQWFQLDWYTGKQKGIIRVRL